MGAKGTVRLDARFDAGYFVSVRAANQDFRGVLYYPPPAHVRCPAGDDDVDARGVRARSASLAAHAGCITLASDILHRTLSSLLCHDYACFVCSGKCGVCLHIGLSTWSQFCSSQC